MKISGLLAELKAWSNFRLMVLVGAGVVILSTVGAVYVQAAISGPDRNARLDASEPAVPIGGDSSPGPRLPASSPTATENLARADEPVLIDTEQSFRLVCNPAPPMVTGTTGTSIGCRVDSLKGLSEPVDLACDQIPPGLSCEFQPPSVTPPSNGSAPFQMVIGADSAPPAGYQLAVSGRTRSGIERLGYPLIVLPAAAPGAVARPEQAAQPAPLPPVSASAPPPVSLPPVPVPVPVVTTPTSGKPPDPSFTIGCTLASDPAAVDKLLWAAKDGPTGKIKCFLIPTNGFARPVSLSVANKPDQIEVSFSPAVIDLGAGDSPFFDLNFELKPLTAGTEYVFDLVATSQDETLVRRVQLTASAQPLS